MTALSELAGALFPDAVRVGARVDPTTETTVAWVRVMRARVPAFDALEPGDLAIVPEATLAVVAPSRDERLQLVEACRTARIAGMLLIEREVRAGERVDTPASGVQEGAFADLAAGLEAAGLPALRVAPADAGRLERSIIGYLVTGGAELERQAAALENHLERVALEGGGPAALVGAIASHFGRAVALEGRRGDPLAVHAPAELPESALDATRYQARPREPVALRVPLPAAGAAGAGAVTEPLPAARAARAVGAGTVTEPDAARAAGAGRMGSSGGALVLLGSRPPNDLERVAVGRIAGLLALELSRDEAVRRARDATRRAEALPSAGPPWVVLLARQRMPDESDDAAEAVDRREANRRELRLIAPARRMVLRGDAESLEIRAVLAVDPPGGPDPAGLAAASGIAAFLGRTVAVSRPFGAVGERPTAEAEARGALEAAEALPDSRPVAQAALLPTFRMLGALHHLGDGDRLARALLEPLLAGRTDVRTEHLATLRAVLDRGGLGEAATALGVHRNTVAYRLRRIEVITGWDLTDPDVRFALSTALRLVHNP